MINLDSILQCRDITLPQKVHIVKAMVFPSDHVQRWELDHRRAESQRIDAFELCCWRRLLRVPWTARRWNQSILKEINPESSFEGLMLKLKLQYIWCKGLTHWKRPCCWERLRSGGEGDDRMWGTWSASWTQQTWFWANSRGWWGSHLQSMGLQSQMQLSDRITTINQCMFPDGQQTRVKMLSITKLIVIRDMEVKTTTRQHFTPVRMGIIKKIYKELVLQGVEEKGNPPTLLLGM